MADDLLQITQLDPLVGATVATDLLVIVDGSDLTQSAAGTTKKLTMQALRTDFFAGYGTNDPLTSGAITATGNSTITGTLGGITTLTATTVTATNVGGTLTTAAQPNITSVGTLTALALSGALTVSATGSVFSVGTDASTNVSIGNGGAAPTAQRTVVLYLDAPHSGTFVGQAQVTMRRAGTRVWEQGIDSATTGAKSSNTDYYWYSQTAGAYVAALSAAGALNLAGGITAGAASFTTGAFSGNVTINTNKVTFDAATGNTVVAGTLTGSAAGHIGAGVWPGTTVGFSGSRVGMFSATEDGQLWIGNMNTASTGAVGINYGASIYLGARGTDNTANLAFAELFGGRESAASGNLTSYLSFRTSNAAGARTEGLRISSTQAATFASTVAISNTVTITNAAAATLILNTSSAANGAGSIQMQNNGVQKWNIVGKSTTNDFAIYNNGGINDYAFTIAHATGAATFASTVAVTSTLDVQGTNGIYKSNGDADNELFINYQGYNGGTTRFRSTALCNGKNARLLTADGPNNQVVVASGVALQLGAAASASVATPSTHKIAVKDSAGATYYLLVTT